jgi:N4-gp56 family major capsid protein
MAFGTDHVISTDVPNFIPELWSDEVVASYKSNLVYANNVRKLNHRGKKGDTIKVPTPSRASASSKSEQALVTFIEHGTDAGISVSINKHYEYSRLIEDLVDVQALESLRRFYTDDGGYAIAKEVDTQLILEGLRADATIVTVTAGIVQDDMTVTGTIYEGDGTTWDQSTSTDISDAGIRAFVKALDDVDAPMSGRVMIVPTIVKQDLLGLSRFTEQAFVGETGAGNSIRNGLIGDIYGIEVFVTTNLPQIDNSAGSAQVQLAQVFQKDAIVLVEQLGVRAQSQYKQEYLADLFTVDMIWGNKVVRPTSVVNFVVPTT